MIRHRLVSLSVGTMVLAAMARPAAAGTTWSVVYLDVGKSTGFYDPSPRSPVGGNQGTTLGEQRRIAFEKALSTWGSVLSSPVPITVTATMTALPCDADGAVLGQASAATAASVPAPGTNRSLAYPIALANAIEGTDLEPVSAESPNGAEIEAEFNSNLGNANCLDGTHFYLGLDGKAGSEETDFLSVVLHELGHGLGFSTFLDLATAEPLFADAPDAFSTHVFDLDRQSTWDALGQSQLLASMGNARRVVWNGSHVTQAAPRYLVKGSPRMSVSPAISGLSGVLSEHDDGPKLADTPATGPLVIPNPATGCSEPTNGSSLRGSIALVDPRGACHPLEAVGWMEVVGAKAVLAVDSTGAHPPAMVVGILEDQLIPVVSISREDAALLVAQGVGRTMTLDGDSTRLVGADAQGRLYLYATNPVLEGSSISHWDSLARNQLLMEPEQSTNQLSLDLTREFMWDLGWGICGDGTIQGTESCDDGNTADGDGCSAACAVVATSAGGRSSSSGGNSANGGSSNAPNGVGGSASVTSSTPNPDKEVSCSCGLPRSDPAGYGAIAALAIVPWLRRRRGNQRRAAVSAG